MDGATSYPEDLQEGSTPVGNPGPPSMPRCWEGSMTCPGAAASAITSGRATPLPSSRTTFSERQAVGSGVSHAPPRAKSRRGADHSRQGTPPKDTLSRTRQAYEKKLADKDKEIAQLREQLQQRNFRLKLMQRRSAPDTAPAQALRTGQTAGCEPGASSSSRAGR